MRLPQGRSPPRGMGPPAPGSAMLTRTRATYQRGVDLGLWQSAVECGAALAEGESACWTTRARMVGSNGARRNYPTRRWPCWRRTGRRFETRSLPGTAGSMNRAAVERAAVERAAAAVPRAARVRRTNPRHLPQGDERL